MAQSGTVFTVFTWAWIAGDMEGADSDADFEQVGVLVMVLFASFGWFKQSATRVVSDAFAPLQVS